MEHRGVLISFEGGEGCGKSTQAARLLASLTGRGFQAILTQEPGGTPLGEWVRRFLLARPDAALESEHSPGDLPGLVLTALEEFLLFSAARARLVNEVLRPALGQGQVVLLDRYYYSSYAYQSAGGLDIDWMRGVTRVVVAEWVPDLVILLDLPVAQGLARKRLQTSGNKADRFEMREVAFHQRVRLAYLELAREEPERFRVINGEDEPDAVFREVESIVGKLLSDRGIQPRPA